MPFYHTIQLEYLKYDKLLQIFVDIIIIFDYIISISTHTL